MLKEVSPVFKVLDSLSVSGAVTYVSSASGILFKDSVGYQVHCTGVPTGTLNIDACLDYNPQWAQNVQGSPNNGNWTTIVGQTIGSGTAFPVLFNLNQLSQPYTRLSFVSTTSSGVLAAYFVAKSLG